MKYIDAEKLKERIEKLDMESCIPDKWDGFYYAVDSVLEVITSLQQEQPEGDFDIKQELYHHFGQVKDFTLGLAIASYFYELGLNARKEE